MTLFVRTVIGLALLASMEVAAQEAEQPDSGAATTSDSAPTTTVEQQPEPTPNSGPEIGRFEPSEEISEDLSVSYPVDI